MNALLLMLMAAATIDHSSWDALLKKYLNEESRVDYNRLKQEDLPALDRYIAQMAEAWPASLTQEQQKAALINAYNALTIRWVLEHYPIESIWKTKKPFREARHTVNGEKMSLDDIETRLRRMGDPRIHAALVCAARSCPPLRREAYVAERLDRQLDENTRAWLANPKLNRFEPSKSKAEVSSIFKWYKEDFNEKGATLKGFLARFGPEKDTGFLKDDRAKIDFMKYHWGLNDTGPSGEGYSSWSFYWDALRNR
jgi:hypothetical protein